MDAGSSGVAPTTARDDGSGRWALVVFVVYVAAALPLLVLVLGDQRWFHRDDWAVLAGRDLSLQGVFEPLLGTQMLAVPVVVFRALWTAFGATSYTPYLIAVVAVHLGVAVVLRVLLRHVGVGPWLATIGASILVLCGPVHETYFHATQMNYTFSLLFGIGQLLLADHEGPIGRRDALALGLGMLGVLSSLVGIHMTVVVGAAVLVRRGWRPAALQTVPLAAVVVAWVVAMDPTSVSPSGAPTLGTTLRWVGWSIEGLLQVLGRAPVVGGLLLLLTLGGLGLAVAAAPTEGATSRPERVRARLRPVAVPMAMLGGALLFSGLAARGRWTLGESGAQSDRYLYVMAVLTIPALCLAAETVARRWPRARPAVVVLLLLPIPFNIRSFDEPPFSAPYFAKQEALITGTVDLPLAHEVPADAVPPGWNPTMSKAMTVGFLLDAHAQGRLPAFDGPLPPRLQDELTLRLIAYQDHARGPATGCRQITSSLELDPEVGDRYRVTTPVQVALVESAADPPTQVRVNPARAGRLVFQVGGIPVVLSPPPGADGFEICDG
jgi:hypothetical protein